MIGGVVPIPLFFFFGGPPPATPDQGMVFMSDEEGTVAMATDERGRTGVGG